MVKIFKLVGCLLALVQLVIAQVPAEALLDDMEGFEYDLREVDVFDVTDSVVSFESRDTIVEVVIDSNKVLLENIKNEINQIRYLQSDKTSSYLRSKVVIKGAGTVMFLTGIAGLIATIINANHTEKIPVVEPIINRSGDVTRSKTVTKDVKNKWNSAHTALTFVSGGMVISGCVTWAF
jgi:hypothetical protein